VVRPFQTLSAGIFAAALLIAPGQAQDFYAGKTVNLIVGYSAGGGYDQYARLLARHLGRFIPGRPAIVVQNMPGAASLNAVRHLSTNAPRDGTAVAMFDPGLILETVADPERFRLKLSDYQWIGAMSREVTICYAWHATGITTFADMLSRREFLIGATAKGSAVYVNGRALLKLFNDPADCRLPGQQRTAPGGRARRARGRLRVLERDPAGLGEKPPHQSIGPLRPDATGRHAADALCQRPRRECR
jgi:hypothetical protein